MINSSLTSGNEASYIASQLRDLASRAHRWDGDPETAVLLLARVGTLKNIIDRDPANPMLRWLDSLARLIEKRRSEFRARVVGGSPQNGSRTRQKLAGVS